MKSISLVLLVISADVFGQFDVDAYLAQSSNDLEIQALNAQWDYLNETDFRSPFLREVEFRVRARDFDTGPDDYRLRFSPLNPYERRANKQYASSLDEQMESQRMVDYSSVLESRYQLLIKHIYLKQYLNLEGSYKVYYRRLLEAKSKIGGNAKDLIELDRSILSIDLKQEDLRTELARAEFLIRTGYNFDGDISWDNYPLASVETIQTQLSLLNFSGSQENIYVQNEKNKIRVRESDLEINRQESFSNIGFVQAEYKPYRGESFGETMGMQIGFQLPIVNPDRPDLERRKLRLIKDQKDVKEMESEVEMGLFNYRNSLETILRQHDLVTQKLASLQKFAMSASFSNVASLLELREYRDDLQKMQLEMYTQILSAYIHWLQYNGKLAEVPYRNYLSDEIGTFEIN